MSVSEELGKLGELHQRGVLSDEEFAGAKARVLHGTPCGDGAPRVGPGPQSAINALRRSITDRWIGGVCGGVAQVTGVASWVWRLLFILGVVFAGSGILLYVLMWILVPQEPYWLPEPNDPMRAG